MRDPGHPRHAESVSFRAAVDTNPRCSAASIALTGLGFLQNVRINNGQVKELQYNLLKSHACGLGDEVPKDIVKLMLMLKIKSLSYGYSGVQVDTVKRLMDMYNNDVLPVIYTQGSLGASGDLAPLSHLSLPLIG